MLIRLMLPLILLAWPNLAAAQRHWYASQAEPTYFKLEMNLANVRFTNPGRDPYKLASWLGGPGKVEMEMRMRRDLGGRIPFEFELENPDLAYRFTVYCEIQSSSVELKVRDLTVRLDVLETKGDVLRPVTTDRASNSFRKVAVSLEQLKDLIMALAGELVDRQNHYSFSRPKFIISIEGQAFSASFSPGPMGPFEMRIQQRAIRVRLNDRLLSLPQPIRFEAVETPIFGPEASVKMIAADGRTHYLRFLDRISTREAAKRAEQLNNWQK